MSVKTCLDCSLLDVEYFDEELESYCPQYGSDMKQDLKVCELFKEVKKVMIKELELNGMVNAMYENSLKNICVVLVEALKKSKKEEVHNTSFLENKEKRYELKISLKKQKCIKLLLKEMIIL